MNFYSLYTAHKLSPLPQLIYFLACLLALQAFPATAGDLDSAAYRDQLQANADKLQRMSHQPIRPLDKAEQPLEGSATVVRRDGAKQTANGDEWTRANSGSGSPTNATPEEVREAAARVAARRRALEEWAPADGAYYEPAEAGRIVNQLVETGQISNSPTWMQTAWSAVRKGFSRTIGAFGKWLNKVLFGWLSRWRPSAPNVPNLPDPTLGVRVLFAAAVLALLFVLFRLVSRSIRGSAGKRERRGESGLSGEDEELLQLPLGELQSRAERYAAEGNYRQALRHLYLALLVHLEEFGVWHYDTRRTNWEHIAALRRHDTGGALVAPLSDLTRRFDRVRYGNANCERTDWQRFSSDVATLETAIAPNEPQRR